MTASHPSATTMARVLEHPSRRALERNNKTMKATAQRQQLNPTVAPVSPTKPSTRSSRQSQHWSDEVWQEKQIPRAVTMRLSAIDRALQGVMGMHNMLLNDERKAEWCGAIRESGPDPLRPSQIEDLHSIIEVLLLQASKDMQQLRDHDEYWQEGEPK